jgi:hypothetical protein
VDEEKRFGYLRVLYLFKLRRHGQNGVFCALALLAPPIVDAIFAGKATWW